MDATRAESIPGLDLARKEELVRRFFPGTGATYDAVARTTTLGLDASWKQRVIALVPRSARRILDLACGTGILTFHLLRHRPAARVVGVDITEEYLAVARERHRRRGGNAAFVLSDAHTAPLASHAPFDAAVSCYLPKYADAPTLLAHIDPFLAPGARVVFHDFTRPRGALARALWRAWFRVLDGWGPEFFPGWERVFDRTLRDLIERSDWVGQFRGALEDLGYRSIRKIRLSFSSAAIVTAVKPLNGRL
jgi:demethylmenaquinone methyltransferase/2-methoxy-6-polyprenyl-1,4-benzoquinol methylase